MIVVQMLMDEAAHPLQAVWYQRQVATALGDDLDQRYRLWFVDHAMHESPEGAPVPGDVAGAVRAVRTVSYRGVVEQALLDLSAWVERGVAPAASTEFDVVEGQVVVPSTATARRGIQPVVDLRISNPGPPVSVGDTVSFVAEVEVPPGAGFVIGSEWDFLGTGEFALVSAGIDGSKAKVTVDAEAVFERPGTYFPAVRITSQRAGDTAARHGRVQNLGRVRVIVTP